MDIQANRRAMLAAWIREKCKNSQAEFIRATDINQGELSALLKGKSFGEKKARKLEKSARMPEGYLDGTADALELTASNHAIRRAFVPVVGTAQLGPDGFWDELGYPVGHGDGFVDYPMRDQGAYALRVKGDSMRPRIKPGEYVIVEPGHAIAPGDEVLVKFRDGRRSIKKLGPRRNGTTELQSVNDDFKPMTPNDEEIEALHFVSAIVTDSWYRADLPQPREYNVSEDSHLVDEAHQIKLSPTRKKYSR